MHSPNITLMFVICLVFMCVSPVFAKFRKDKIDVFQYRRESRRFFLFKNRVPRPRGTGYLVSQLSITPSGDAPCNLLTFDTNIATNNGITAINQANPAATLTFMILPFGARDIASFWNVLDTIEVTTCVDTEPFRKRVTVYTWRHYASDGAFPLRNTLVPSDTDATILETHFYLKLGGAPTWDGAVVACDQSPKVFELQGYLATATQEDENTLMGDWVGWLGGSDSGIEGVWSWRTGPNAGSIFWTAGGCRMYCNWEPGEPNNAGGQHSLFRYAQKTWDDNGGGAAPICEYGRGNSGLEYEGAITVTVTTRTITFTNEDTLTLTWTLTNDGTIEDTESLSLTTDASMTASVTHKLSQSISETLSNTESETISMSSTRTGTFSSSWLNTLTSTLSDSEEATDSLSLTETVTLPRTHTLTMDYTLTGTKSVSIDDTWTLTNTDTLSGSFTSTQTYPTLTELRTTTLTMSTSSTAPVSQSLTWTNSGTDVISSTHSETNTILATNSVTESMSRTLTKGTFTEGKTNTLTFTNTLQETRSDTGSGTVEITLSVTASKTMSETKDESKSQTRSAEITLTSSITKDITLSSSPTLSLSDSKTTTRSSTITESFSSTNIATLTHSISNSSQRTMTHTIPPTRTPTMTSTASISPICYPYMTLRTFQLLESDIQSADDDAHRTIIMEQACNGWESVVKLSKYYPIGWRCAAKNPKCSLSKYREEVFPLNQGHLYSPRGRLMSVIVPNVDEFMVSADEVWELVLDNRTVLVPSILDYNSTHHYLTIISDHIIHKLQAVLKSVATVQHSLGFLSLFGSSQLEQTRQAQLNGARMSCISAEESELVDELRDTIIPLPFLDFIENPHLSVVVGDTLIFLGTLFATFALVTIGRSLLEGRNFARMASIIGFPQFGLTVFMSIQQPIMYAAIRLLLDAHLGFKIVGAVLVALFGIAIPFYSWWLHARSFLRYFEYRQYRTVFPNKKYLRYAYFDGSWGPSHLSEQYSVLITNCGPQHRLWFLVPMLCTVLQALIVAIDFAPCYVRYLLLGLSHLIMSVLYVYIQPLRWGFLHNSLFFVNLLLALTYFFEALAAWDEMIFALMGAVIMNLILGLWSVISGVVEYIWSLIESLYTKDKLWPEGGSIPWVWKSKEWKRWWRRRRKKGKVNIQDDSADVVDDIVRSHKSEDETFSKHPESVDTHRSSSSHPSLYTQFHNAVTMKSEYDFELVAGGGGFESQEMENFAQEDDSHWSPSSVSPQSSCRVVRTQPFTFDPTWVPTTSPAATMPQQKQQPLHKHIILSSPFQDSREEPLLHSFRSNGPIMPQSSSSHTIVLEQATRDASDEESDDDDDDETKEHEKDLDLLLGAPIKPVVKNGTLPPVCGAEECAESPLSVAKVVSGFDAFDLSKEPNLRRKWKDFQI
eukprot:PhF_6_TR10383/c0_g2_i1/m.16185